MRRNTHNSAQHLPMWFWNMKLECLQLEWNTRQYTKVSRMRLIWLGESSIILSFDNSFIHSISRSWITNRHDYEDSKKWSRSTSKQDVSHCEWTRILYCLTRCLSPTSLSCWFIVPCHLKLKWSNHSQLQNHVRRALNRDYYINDTHLLDEEHISHCVDAIRQSLMLVMLQDVFVC